MSKIIKPEVERWQKPFTGVSTFYYIKVEILWTGFKNNMTQSLFPTALRMSTILSVLVKKNGEEDNTFAKISAGSKSTEALWKCMQENIKQRLNKEGVQVTGIWLPVPAGTPGIGTAINSCTYKVLTREHKND